MKANVVIGGAIAVGDEVEVLSWGPGLAGFNP
jgi:hypothetical protein